MAEVGVHRAKAAFPSGCESHPAILLQPETIGAVIEITKWLKPSMYGQGQPDQRPGCRVWDGGTPTIGALASGGTGLARRCREWLDEPLPLLTGWPVGDLKTLDHRVAELDHEINVIAQSDPVAKRLQQLRGIGPMVAMALVATVGNAEQFANGRQMAASLGLTPRQHSSGGKDRILGISKRGDAHLRSILIHGARSVIRTAKTKDDRLSQWVTSLAERRHPNVAAVALANKTARIAWAMLRNGTDYEPDYIVA